SDWAPGKCTGRNVEPFDLQDHAETDYFMAEFPFKLAPREWLLRTQFVEDPKTKAIAALVKAVPDALPRNNCCYRLATFNSSWRLTPVENGETEVEYILNTDEGLPYLLVNAVKPRATYKFFEDLPRLFGQEQYRNAKPDAWKEYLLANQ
ncbi:MAG TPA: hypothetical protein VFQ06_10170, partial [Nitrospira sp.]|nr:hypothetical protein [Nitrospira sp.]